MNIRHTLPALALLCTTLSAQQLVRGDVDSIQGTRRFQLDCTNIELVSNTVNLQALHDASRQNDIEYEMMVTRTTSGGRFALNVLSAKPIQEIFSMGNIRLGRSDTWELFGAPGSAAGIFITLRSGTSYAPLGAPGTWLVGNQSLLFARGTVGPIGRFQVRYEPPNNPALVGLEVVGQGVLIDRGSLLIANPDCKTVRSR